MHVRLQTLPVYLNVASLQAWSYRACAGGPSDGKLMPGDCIQRVNGEDVEQAPREHVIEQVRYVTSEDVEQAPREHVIGQARYEYTANYVLCHEAATTTNILLFF